MEVGPKQKRLRIMYSVSWTSIVCFSKSALVEKPTVPVSQFATGYLNIGVITGERCVSEDLGFSKEDNQFIVEIRACADVDKLGILFFLFLVTGKMSYS